MINKRQVFFAKFDTYFLGFFILLYGFFILPLRDYKALFTIPRIDLILAFIILYPIIRMFSAAEMNFSDLLSAYKNQSKFLRLLPFLAIAMLISTYFAVDKTTTWFGPMGTQMGTYFLLLLLPVFWIFSTAKQVSYTGTIVLAITTSILAIIEFLGFRPLHFITSRYGELNTAFPAVTEMHKGQLAGLIVIFLGIIAYYSKRYKNYKSSYFIFFLTAVALGCTTNSAGIFAAIITFLLLSIFYFPKRDFKPLIFLILLIFGYISHYPMASLGNYLYKIGLTHEMPLGKSLADTSTFRTRIYLWKAGINIFKSHPIFGIGPQNYGDYWFFYLNKQDSSRLLSMELGIPADKIQTVYRNALIYKDDKGKSILKQVNYISSHNAYIDFLSSFGILGGIIISIILYYIISFFYIYKNIYALGLMAMYGIYLLAWFITVPVFPIFLMLLGLLIADQKSEMGVSGNSNYKKEIL